MFLLLHGRQPVGNVVSATKLFLNLLGNIFAFWQANFVSARMFSDVGKQKNIDRKQFIPVNSKLDWNDNLAAIFEAKFTFNRPSCLVLFYCICRHS